MPITDSVSMLAMQTTARMFPSILPGLPGGLRVLFPLSGILVPSHLLDCLQLSLPVLETQRHLCHVPLSTQSQSNGRLRPATSNTTQASAGGEHGGPR